VSGLFKRPVEKPVTEPVVVPEATKGLMQRQPTEDELTVQALLKALGEYEANPLK
jgi:hypothetical protein